MITVGVLKETNTEERRVAAVPDTVTKMVKANMTVVVETGAGLASFIEDQAYQSAGASIVANAADVLNRAQVVFKVRVPSVDVIALMKEKSVLIAPLFPLRNLDLVQKLNEKMITAFSMDLLPRIARAQSMDILSSMSNLAGYKSVILAANHLSKIFPMMTTAAGTITPAKVIVIGAGVAGLQAIATARRLGGVVLGFDTRPVTAEQVKSLGADFVSLETTHEEAQEAGGYAKEQSAEFYKKEQEIVREYSKNTDVIITTALIPGKKAPILITEEMVKEMKAGSVIVDLAAEQGGNCALTEAGKIVEKHGITIIGSLNLPSTLAVNASLVYAKNMYAFLTYIAPQIETDQYDLADDIIKGCLITHQGKILHPAVNKALQKG